MMGTKERNFSPPESASREELVPEGNFYRRLEETLHPHRHRVSDREGHVVGFLIRAL